MPGSCLNQVSLVNESCKLGCLGKVTDSSVAQGKLGSYATQAFTVQQGNHSLQRCTTQSNLNHGGCMLMGVMSSMTHTTSSIPAAWLPGCVTSIDQASSLLVSSEEIMLHCGQLSGTIVCHCCTFATATSCQGIHTYS